MYDTGNYTESEGSLADKDEGFLYYNNSSDNIYSSVLFSSKICEHWNDLNHIYFQIANIFFFLSYLAPNGVYGMLYLRSSLMVGCIFFALWSWAVKCYLDALVWNLTFVFINFVYICSSLFYMSPYKFQKEIEEVSVCAIQQMYATPKYRLIKKFNISLQGDEINLFDM